MPRDGAIIFSDLTGKLLTLQTTSSPTTFAAELLLPSYEP
jgi:hypothetical protein